MAVEGYIGWASHVNKVIFSDTTLTFGENATRTDELESGGKKTSLKGSYVPDKFNVTMLFEADENVSYTDVNENRITLDKTEFQLFIEWYKYRHKYGTVPFEFPKIVYSPQTGIKVIDDKLGNTLVEYYKITSAVEGSKLGSLVQVKMTWESVYGGIITISSDTPKIKGISKLTSNYIDITFSQIADTEPTKDYFTLYIDDKKIDMTGFYFDGAYTARIYFESLEHGTHIANFEISDYSGLTVSKGTYFDSITV